MARARRALVRTFSFTASAAASCACSSSVDSSCSCAASLLAVAASMVSFSTSAALASMDAASCDSCCFSAAICWRAAASWPLMRSASLRLRWFSPLRARMADCAAISSAASTSSAGASGQNCISSALARFWRSITPTSWRWL